MTQLPQGIVANDRDYRVPRGQRCHSDILFWYSVAVVDQIFKTAEENRVMHRMLHMEPSLCTGCLQCEMACSYEHEGSSTLRGQANSGFRV